MNGNKKNLIFTIGIIGVVVLVIIFIVVNSRKNNPPIDNGQNQNGGNVQTNLRPIDSTDHIWGDINASVKMILYDDFECPFCAVFYQTSKQIKEEFGNQVVIAFRHYPLGSHPEAEKAAEASECAAEQGKFWQMYDKLFNENIAGVMSLEQFKLDAADLGVDMAQFNQCLDTGKYKDKVQAQMLEGANVGVTGTPTIFANGEIYPGAYPMDDFKDKQGRNVEGMRNIINRLLGN